MNGPWEAKPVMKFMNLFQLRYFITVAQLENMSQAAELLHMSQSSLSKSISNLEEALGMTLFDRKGKKIVLNARGRRFLACSRQMFQELELAVTDMKALAGISSQRIRVGVAGGSSSVVECITSFQKKRPEAVFDLRCDIDIQEYLDINDYDVLVYPEDLRFKKLSSYRLEKEKYFLAVSHRHPLAAQTSVQIKDLSGLEFVVLCRGDSSLEYSIEFPCRVCVALNLPFRVQCFADNREIQQQMIISGDAVGFIPAGSVLTCNQERLKLLPIADAQFSRQILLSFRREKHLSPLARKFKHFALDYFQLGQEEEVREE